ncbi:MAG TPA: creatininase family protein, partial [Ignisphaera sp.]|nr:creatininase family protein [Ignisphaera sp.]
MECPVKVWLLSGSKFDSIDKKIAILPIGSIERHGDHLPLGTDTIEAMYIAERVAEKLCIHLFPPIWYGSSRGLRRFSGTIDIGDEPLYHYVYRVLLEIARHGYKLIVVLNGHGGNTQALRLAAKRASFDSGAAIAVINWWSEVAQDKRKELFKYPGHAGEDETSAMLYIAPETVDMSVARDHVVDISIDIALYSPEIEELLYPYAVLGKATMASAEKGKIWIESVVEELSSKIKDIA